MKKTFLLKISALSLFLTSFDISVQNLNELGNWCDFHRISGSDFLPVKNSIKWKLEWKEYDLGGEELEYYRPFRIYSPDSTYFIDLDSYYLLLDRENGKLVSEGKNVDQKSQVVRSRDQMASTLLFCGSGCYIETAYWSSKETLHLLGFSLDENEHFVPEKLTFNMQTETLSSHQLNPGLNKPPRKYDQEVRLRAIEFR